MDWQVIEDSKEAVKGNAEVLTMRDGFEKKEKERPREDQNSAPNANQKEPENVARKKEECPNAVALSNHRFDPLLFSFLKPEFDY